MASPDRIEHPETSGLRTPVVKHRSVFDKQRANVADEPAFRRLLALLGRGCVRLQRLRSWLLTAELRDEEKRGNEQG